jgi:hypothetical protein
MKSYASFFRLASACLLAVVTSAIASAFEGRVELTMTSSDSNSLPITYFLKGAHMRTEMVVPADKDNKNGTTMVSLMDFEKKEITMLMPDQKMYMVHTLADESDDKSDSKKTDTDFQPTGRKEKIAGIEAAEYVGQTKKKQTEIWVTKELGTFMIPSQGKGGKKSPQNSAWAKFAEKEGFFALRVIQRAKPDAPVDFQLEVTKVEKGSQADKLFVPPSDYQKFEMPSMGDMMKGMIPGR